MVFLHPILKLLGATDSILPFAATYASIYIVSCIFNVFNVTMNNIVTSEGAAKTTMCALLTGAVLNIALDPLFIYVFDLRVAGAAIATSISQVVSTCVYLTYILRKKSVFHFRIKDCAYTKETLSENTSMTLVSTKETMSEIFKIGIPTLVFQILTSVSISLINNAAGDYGDSAIAGMGVVTRLISMGSLSVFGFIKGFQPIAGYSYGAKKFDRLREAIKTSILWSTAFCVIFGVILALFPTAIVSRFTKGDAEMIRIGAVSLRANGISIMLFGFYTVYSSLFLALGKGREGFILGACRQGICFIPVILLLPIVWGLNGIMYAQPIADVLSAIITVFMAIPLHKKLNEMQKQTAAINTNNN
jgi:putative MATE family efflux protein